MAGEGDTHAAGASDGTSKQSDVLEEVKIPDGSSIVSIRQELGDLFRYRPPPPPSPSTESSDEDEECGDGHGDSNSNGDRNDESYSASGSLPVDTCKDGFRSTSDAGDRDCLDGSSPTVPPATDLSDRCVSLQAVIGQTPAQSSATATVTQPVDATELTSTRAPSSTAASDAAEASTLPIENQSRRLSSPVSASPPSRKRARPPALDHSTAAPLPPPIALAPVPSPATDVAASPDHERGRAKEHSSPASEDVALAVDEPASVHHADASLPLRAQILFSKPRAPTAVTALAESTPPPEDGAARGKASSVRSCPSEFPSRRTRSGRQTAGDDSQRAVGPETGTTTRLSAAVSHTQSDSSAAAAADRGVTIDATTREVPVRHAANGTARRRTRTGVAAGDSSRTSGEDDVADSSGSSPTRGGGRKEPRGGKEKVSGNPAAATRSRTKSSRHVLLPSSTADVAAGKAKIGRDGRVADNVSGSDKSTHEAGVRQPSLPPSCAPSDGTATSTSVDDLAEARDGGDDDVSFRPQEMGVESQEWGDVASVDCTGPVVDASIASRIETGSRLRGHASRFCPPSTARQENTREATDCSNGEDDLRESGTRSTGGDGNGHAHLGSRADTTSVPQREHVANGTGGRPSDCLGSNYSGHRDRVPEQSRSQSPGRSPTNGGAMSSEGDEEGCAKIASSPTEDRSHSQQATSVVNFPAVGARPSAATPRTLREENARDVSSPGRSNRKVAETAPLPSSKRARTTSMASASGAARSSARASAASAPARSNSSPRGKSCSQPSHTSGATTSITSCDSSARAPSVAKDNARATASRGQCRNTPGKRPSTPARKRGSGIDGGVGRSGAKDRGGVQAPTTSAAGDSSLTTTPAAGKRKRPARRATSDPTNPPKSGARGAAKGRPRKRADAADDSEPVPSTTRDEDLALVQELQQERDILSAIHRRLHREIVALQSEEAALRKALGMPKVHADTAHPRTVATAPLAGLQRPPPPRNTAMPEQDTAARRQGTDQPQVAGTGLGSRPATAPACLPAGTEASGKDIPVTMSPPRECSVQPATSAGQSSSCVSVSSPRSETTSTGARTGEEIDPAPEVSAGPRHGRDANSIDACPTYSADSGSASLSGITVGGTSSSPPSGDIDAEGVDKTPPLSSGSASPPREMAASGASPHLYQPVRGGYRDIQSAPPSRCPASAAETLAAAALPAPSAVVSRPAEGVGDANAPHAPSSSVVSHVPSASPEPSTSPTQHGLARGRTGDSHDRTGSARWTEECILAATKGDGAGCEVVKPRMESSDVSLDVARCAERSSPSREQDSASIGPKEVHSSSPGSSSSLRGGPAAAAAAPLASSSLPQGRKWAALEHAAGTSPPKSSSPDAETSPACASRDNSSLTAGQDLLNVHEAIMSLPKSVSGSSERPAEIASETAEAASLAMPGAEDGSRQTADSPCSRSADLTLSPGEQNGRRGANEGMASAPAREKSAGERPQDAPRTSTSSPESAEDTHLMSTERVSPAGSPLSGASKIVCTSDLSKALLSELPSPPVAGVSPASSDDDDGLNLEELLMGDAGDDEGAEAPNDGGILPHRNLEGVGSALGFAELMGSFDTGGGGSTARNPADQIGISRGSRSPPGARAPAAQRISGGIGPRGGAEALLANGGSTRQGARSGPRGGGVRGGGGDRGRGRGRGRGAIASTRGTIGRGRGRKTSPALASKSSNRPKYLDLNATYKRHDARATRGRLASRGGARGGRTGAGSS